MNYAALFDHRKNEILNSSDKTEIYGTKYYVSEKGDDLNDGLTPNTPWKTLKKVSTAPLVNGDGVFFARGSVFRGKVDVADGVTYAAYGEGEKPKLYGSEMSLACPDLWEIVDQEYHIWKCTQKLLDVGTLVFDKEALHSRKLIPSYKNGKFVCRENEQKDFVLREEMTQDLDLFWHFDEKLMVSTTKGESFPIPDIGDNAYGELYLRCDLGNPGEVFEEIEALSAVHMFNASNKNNVTIDNLCIKYVGKHGVASGGYVVGLHVTNCEFGWIGGAIQHYDGTDPNYPQGGRGSVTRFGNAVEIYGGCDDFCVANNYIYEVYDAGITHQITTSQKVTMSNITYCNNLLEKCVYGIEYFLDQINGESESYMEHVRINNNFIRLTGYGWGQQRHNTDTPAAIKGWSFCNSARDFLIFDNIFDCSAYRLLHLVAKQKEYCPKLKGNTYIQSMGGILGQYGENCIQEPEILMYDNNVEKTIATVFEDIEATVLFENETYVR